MAWPTNPRPAKSLLTLRDQYNAKYPVRSKASDGMLGDALHAQRVSDHNPNAQGVVCALDITHDPAHGLDIAVEAQRLVDSKDPRIRYVIANGCIWEPSMGWQPYNGADPHTGHMHISVNMPNGDDASPWRLSKEKDMATIVDRNIARLLYLAVLHVPADKVLTKDLDNWVGREIVGVVTDMYKSDQWKGQDAVVATGNVDTAKALAKIKEIVGGK